MAIEELLHRFKRGAVELLETLQRPEAMTESLVQRFSIITNNIHAAAARRTVRPKSGHNHVATRLHHLFYLSNVCNPVARIRKKMEDGAIVPYIELGSLEFELSNIAYKPGYPLFLSS